MQASYGLMKPRAKMTTAKTLLQNFGTTTGPNLPTNWKACDPQTNHASTIDQFLGDDLNWYSEAGVRYTPEHMRSLWSMIQCAKRRTLAFYLVDQGHARALNPALQMIATA